MINLLSIKYTGLHFYLTMLCIKRLSKVIHHSTKTENLPVTYFLEEIFILVPINYGILEHRTVWLTLPNQNITMKLYETFNRYFLNKSWSGLNCRLFEV